MGTDNRRNPSSVIDDLVLYGQQYNVWQAIWIAENISKKEYPDRKDFLLEQTGLQFRPSEKYEYPASDLKSVSYEDLTFKFVITFMGLYGINAPLPRCYHDQVDLQQRVIGKGEVPLQNFLDIFNNRFYWLYYQSWKKYRYYLHLKSDEENKVVERINSFTGRGFFSKKRDSVLQDFALLKFSGLFSMRVRNKAGLQILLIYNFPGIDMSIKEFVPRWVELSDIPKVSDNECRLGQTSFIGKYAVDYTSRICIDIGPISFENYLGFLPGKEKSIKLIELLKIYLNDGLEFDFNFKILSDTIVTVSWNDDRLKLGTSLWLGKPGQEFINVYLPYEEIMQVN